MLCSRMFTRSCNSKLRAVFVLIEKENEYKLIFYYHEELSEEEEELASLVDTEFIADFPSPNYKNTMFNSYSFLILKILLRVDFVFTKDMKVKNIIVSEG